MTEKSITDKSNALVSIAGLIIIIFGMQAAKVLLVPFLLALFLALISVRPMLWLQSKKVPAVLAALVIVITMMLIIGLVSGVVGTSVAEFTAGLPAYQARLEAIVEGIGAVIFRLSGEQNGSLNIAELVDPGFLMGLVATILNALQGALTNTFLILFTIIFILLEASSMSVKAEAAFGRTAASFRRSRKFLDNLGRYLGIKTVISMVTGLLVGLITWWIGLDFPLLWGMIAFLLNYVPTIGSIIASVPAILMALVQLGVGEAVTTGLAYFGINILFGSFLEPRLLGYGVGISPLIVFTGLVIWGWILGPVGMLLSVPLTMALKMALEHNERTRWIAILIGSESDAEYALSQRLPEDHQEQ